MSNPLIVVGGGHAAAHLILQLRKDSCTLPIHLVTEEASLPYQRPPLSKGFLAGDVAASRLPIKPAEYYEQQNVEVSLGTVVTQIDRQKAQIHTSDGRSLGYDKLALMTGARVRKLSLPGADLSGIHYLRNIPDVVGIQKHWQAGKKLLIVGGGYIGLEVAAVAARQGLDVTVLEMADRIMNRAVAPEVSAFYHQIHQTEGVKIHTNMALSHFEGKNQVSAAVTADGNRFECDFVIAGVGVLPNQELAEQAGLDCDNGIVVDQYARTSDNNIVAAGDCTNHPNRNYGKQLRLESVHNAMEQAKTAASTLMGNLNAYNQTPWFWSDQYDMKLQMIGLCEGYDELVWRGSVEDKQFSLFYLKKGQLVAANTISNPKEFMQIKKLMQGTPTMNKVKLADPRIDLSSAIEV